MPGASLTYCYRRHHMHYNVVRLPECLKCLLVVRPECRLALPSSISSLPRFNVVGQRRKEIEMSLVHDRQPTIVAGTWSPTTSPLRSNTESRDPISPQDAKDGWINLGASSVRALLVALNPKASLGCIGSRNNRLFLYWPGYMGDDASLYGGKWRSNFTGLARHPCSL